ncbi:hypothetical protein SMACR_04328 [Sordaria macrospora]|uniref:WGS project CABT00000000 data, contig 2.19 n=2 Tax=Sordaria macrospora TaxID=5147 RepID=F7W1I6_SORMK|nr:uncharacterized protein SMAC_04328 [Sordaria macrospora k-hell]KAA8635746.1 hypothetical protein SMACR_04328 [Sordaria macrospora]WPJ57938.1 hypothetical protein SMAC4_04328 [Sordaria macrospora]CCC04961.1 unnamed protein product [Sordaria macrospora k-hell]
MMATTARKARTYWMGAEPLNGLYGLRAFSLLNLGPHSETTGAVNTANQALSTRTGGEVTGAGGVVVVRSVRAPQRAAGFHWGRSMSSATLESTRACKIAVHGPLGSLGRGTRVVVRSVVPLLRPLEVVLLLARVQN